MGKVVQVKTGYSAIALPPFGLPLDAGQSKTLTDAEYAGLSSPTLNAVTVIQSGVADPVRSGNYSPLNLADAVQMAVDAVARSATYAARASNLSDLASAATARNNLGLGTAAVQPSTAFDPAGAAAAVTTTSIGAATTGALATTNSNVTTNTTNIATNTAAIAAVPGQTDAKISANNTTERAAQSATYVPFVSHGSTLGAPTYDSTAGLVTLAVTSQWSMDALGNVDFSPTSVPPTGYTPAVLSIDPATGYPVVTQIAS